MEDEIAWKIASLDVGGYLFWFVETKEERRSVIIPYLSQGVARGEKLLVFGTKSFFQSSLAEEIRSRLDDEGLPATGQLNAFILSETDFGPRDVKGPEDLVTFIRDEMNRGLDEGYPAVRVLVEMDAIVQKCQGVPRLLEFEREIEAFFPHSRSLGLLVLNTSRVDPGLLTGILLTQKKVGICGEIYQNRQAFPAEKIQSPADLTAALLHRIESMLRRQPLETPDVLNPSWYRQIFNEFPGMAAILRPDGIILDISPDGADLVRGKPSDLIGRPIWRLPGWGIHAQAWIKEAIGRAGNGEVSRGEIRLRGENKTTSLLAVSLSPILNEAGGTVSLLCTARDRTTLDNLNRRVEDRDELIQAAASAAPLSLAWIDPNGLIRYATGAIGQRDEGKASRAVVGRSIYSVFADIPEVLRHFERALKGESITTRLEVEGKTYEARYLSVNGEDGHLRGVIASTLDVTRQVWLEDMLYRDEERGRVMMREARVGAYWIDLAARKGQINPVLQQMLGCEKEELLLSDLINLIHPEDLGRVADLAGALEKGEIDHYQDEHRLFRMDGGCIWVRQTVNRYGGIHGEAPFAVGIFEEITRHKQEEDDLRRQGALLKNVLDRVPIGIWITDENGAIITSNPAAEEIWGGFKPAGLEQLSQVQATFLDDGSRLAPEDWALARVLKDGETVLGDVLDILTPDGKHKVLINSAIPIFDHERRLLAAIAVNQDITEQKQIEKELAEVQRQLLVRSEAERLRLAQDLHDGPIQDLYGITFQLHELDEALAHTEFEPIANTIIETLQTVISVLRTMCTEMRPPTLAPFGLEKAIRSHAENFQRRHSGLAITLDLTPDGQILPEDARMGLFRIYQELLNNVVRHANASQVTVRFHLQELQAELEVEDNGQGFEVPRRWVEIVRRGHYGLVGLQERAEALGGWVKIVSAVGQGTHVKVTIPRPAAGTGHPGAEAIKPIDGE